MKFPTICLLKIFMHRLEFKEIRTQICLPLCKGWFPKEQFYYSGYNTYSPNTKKSHIVENFRNLMLELRNSLNILLSTLEQN